jgi:hypothetical protein
MGSTTGSRRQRKGRRSPDVHTGHGSPRPAAVPAPRTPVESAPATAAAPPSAPGEPGRWAFLRRIFRSQGFVVAVLLALVGGGAGAVVSFALAGRQAVDTEQAIAEVHHRHDQRTRAVSVETASYGGVTRSLSTPDVVRDLAGTPVTDLASLLPGHPVTTIGERVDYTATDAQPRVYDKITFTLVGEHYAAVQVVGLRLQEIARAAPLTGTLVYIEPQGADSTQSIGFDLDSPDPSAFDLRDDVPGYPFGGHYFDDHQVVLDKGEHLTFTAMVFTSTCRCDFVIQVELSDGSAVRVEDDGRPWHLSGFAPAYDEVYLPVLRNDGTTVEPCEWPADCTDYYTLHPG